MSNDEHISHERLQQRYIVHYNSGLGPRFSTDTYSTIVAATKDWRLYIEDGYAARIAKLTVVDGHPAAEWVTPEGEPMPNHTNEASGPENPSDIFAYDEAAQQMRRTAPTSGAPTQSDRETRELALHLAVEHANNLMCHGPNVVTSSMVYGIADRFLAFLQGRPLPTDGEEQ